MLWLCGVHEPPTPLQLGSMLLSHGFLDVYAHLRVHMRHSWPVGVGEEDTTLLLSLQPTCVELSSSIGLYNVDACFPRVRSRTAPKALLGVFASEYLERHQVGDTTSPHNQPRSSVYDIVGHAGSTRRIAVMYHSPTEPRRPRWWLRHAQQPPGL